MDGMGKKKSIVYTAGVWDLFHVGHLNRLLRAKELGDFLIVGVNTDDYVKRYKGRDTIIPFAQRLVVVGAIRCVDMASPHYDFEDMSCFDKFDITIRVIGAQYGQYEGERNHLEELKKRCIRVVRLSETPGISSSWIRERCYAMLRTKSKQESCSDYCCRR